MALCVNPKLKYVKVLGQPLFSFLASSCFSVPTFVATLNGNGMIGITDKSSGAKWILAESRLVQLFPTAPEAKGEQGSSEGEDGIVKEALISYDDEAEDKSRVGKVIKQPFAFCRRICDY
jgi:hypothetical protein